MRINDPKYLGSPTDVLHGLRIGAFLGVCFAARELLGSHRAMSRLIGSDVHSSLTAAVIFFGGCFAGVLTGAMRPLARRLPVAVVLGTVAVFPVIIALDVIRVHATYPPNEIRWTVDAISAFLLGTLGLLPSAGQPAQTGGPTNAEADNVAIDGLRLCRKLLYDPFAA